ncbi:zinc metalloprotease Ecym_7192 [Eremothecium cymbalariae DBVPG|uniref:CAAX prenyl protease n=1 Tax=Eremothecium cymbalariae (strain CBS 270.75 / DBVPG 7215 / KCTC 17166 / NRRL Y-17582) TaxID=931890 RepID=G8JW25_ERECY|nr:hypothetical protein Ecym_7192 [Eremothecium cymbalariae DBVPG\
MINVVELAQKAFDRDDIPWKNIVSTLTICQYAFETYLNYRQYKELAKRSVPELLKDHHSAEHIEKSSEYSRDNLKCTMFSDFLSLLSNLAIIKYDLLPRVWNLCAKYTSMLPAILVPKTIYSQSVYFFLFGTILSTIAHAPIKYYKIFVIEEKFGFNKSTVKLWLSDQFKTVALFSSLGGLFTYGCLRIIDACSSNFVGYICAFVLFVQLFLIVASPIIIEPLFNTFKPLEDGELKKSIENLAQRVGFPLSNISVIDGSKRSSHSNAYFSGLPFMNKRIVLFDTLIETHTTEELTAVLGHEIGHWRLNHIFKRVIVGQATIAFTMTLFNSLYRNKSLYQAFGFLVGDGVSSKSSQVVLSSFPIYIGFMLFSDLSSPIECVLQFFSSLLSRLDEYAADDYSRSLGYTESLAAALVRLDKANLLPVHVDKWYSTYHYSHPTLIERLSALEFNKITKRE